NFRTVREVYTVKKFLLILIFLCSFVNHSEAVIRYKVGIIGAMDVEVNLLKERAKISRKVIEADMEFCVGRLDDVNVVIVKCGMGKVNAGICAQMLIDVFDVDCIINTGVAGALNPKLNIGDIVIGSDVVQHDYDVTPIGFKRGEIPYTGKVAFESDKNLIEQAFKAVQATFPKLQVIKGRICTGDQFISTKEQKEKITSNFGGDCCETESGAIAQVCYLNRMPFVIIRAIADKADETQTVDFQEFEAETARNCAAITEYMVKNLTM
ncbi:MAG: 5'-methylthioadenosine/adenosylhomocysteine nucleosidase, partial [Synergistaceae bacterium]|nr:5'-methylthioadenosine/adenosylhomocysteine nucleosidase [Synergistaceae bacterium]